MTTFHEPIVDRELIESSFNLESHDHDDASFHLSQICKSSFDFLILYYQIIALDSYSVEDDRALYDELCAIADEVETTEVDVASRSTPTAANIMVASPASTSRTRRLSTPKTPLSFHDNQALNLDLNDGNDCGSPEAVENNEEMQLEAEMSQRWDIDDKIHDHDSTSGSSNSSEIDDDRTSEADENIVAAVDDKRNHEIVIDTNAHVQMEMLAEPEKRPPTTHEVCAWLQRESKSTSTVTSRRVMDIEDVSYLKRSPVKLNRTRQLPNSKTPSPLPMTTLRPLKRSLSSQPLTSPSIMCTQLGGSQPTNMKFNLSESTPVNVLKKRLRSHFRYKV